jgi:hypothetical protein
MCPEAEYCSHDQRYNRTRPDQHKYRLFILDNSIYRLKRPDEFPVAEISNTRHHHDGKSE